MFRKTRYKQLERGWSSVSTDPKVRSVELAVQLDRLNAGQLLALVELTLAERKRERVWPRRFWLEELLLVGVVAIAALLAWNGMWLKSAGARMQVVVAARDIAAFHKIEKEDLKLAPVGSGQKAFSDPAKLIGQYVIVKVNSGAVLNQRQLAPPEWGDPQVIKFWRVMTVSLKTSPDILGSFDLPGPVTLVASPHSEKLTGAEFDAMLLDYPVGGDAKAALVGIREQDLQRFAAAAGESDLLLVRQVR